MTDIPTDILQTAAAAVHAMPHRPPFKADVLNAIAAAILAERERCAQIARDAHVAHTPQLETYSVDIATAIRSQKDAG